MTILDEDKCLLFIVDIQERLVKASFNSEVIEKKSCIIAKIASMLNIPTIITEQYPKGLGSTIELIKNNLNQENIYYFEKTYFNGLETPKLKDCLNSLNKKQVILCGIESHICVYQTAIALIKEGYEVHLLADVVSSRDVEEYKFCLDIMKNKHIEMKTLEMAIFELLKSSEHPSFKEIQSLIK